MSPEGGQAERSQQDVDEGVVAYTMTCQSGGSLEVYVEPFVPPASLVVVGDSPIARSLLSLGPQLGFDTVGHLDPRTADQTAPVAPDTWLVVASMGDGDELVAEAALRSGVGYVALVASRRRAASVLDYLSERGLSAELVSRLKAPAGLDIGATTPAEIAMSILAEIVSMRRTRRDALALPAAAAEQPARTSIDPVCGMEVDIATARWTTEFNNQTIRFCAPGCRRTFLADPTPFLNALAT